MANSGPNTNLSQFFITTVPAGHLDGKNVVFGVVVEGYNIVQRIESYGNAKGFPSAKIVIKDCGQLS